jgi:hypothetical protein
VEQMAQKKNIAKLVLQAISILGILLGVSCFLCGFAMLSSIQTDDLILLCITVLGILWMLALGAFLVYPSYKMLRGKSFLVIKSMAALLALTFFGSLMEYVEDSTKYFDDMPIEIRAFADLAPFLLVAIISVLIYKICKKLIDRLVEAAYGISNT